MYIVIYLLLGILVITAVLMVLIVLMQRPKNEGLGAAFGGGMTQDLFGAQTTNVLQKFTVYLGAIFFAVCLLLTILYSRTSTQTSDVQKKLAASAAVKKAVPSPSPAASATPVDPNATSVTIPSVDASATVPAADTPEVAPATPAPTASPETMPEAVATP